MTAPRSEGRFAAFIARLSAQLGDTPGVALAPALRPRWEWHESRLSMQMLIKESGHQVHRLAQAIRLLAGW
jgi:hypothetical protein